MPKIIYSTICSLDGYLTDAQGRYDWAVPDEEVVGFVNAQSRPVTTYLCGRRMYAEMSVWETDPAAAGQSPESAEFARLWRAARKVVFSTTLERIVTSRTTLERALTHEVVDRLRSESDGDLFVEGATLAAGAFDLGVIDELQLILAPVAVGGGTPVHPHGRRLDLELVEQRRFTNGMVFLRYDVTRP